MTCICSSDGQFHLLHLPPLLSRQFPEELYFFLTGWLPIIVGLEGGFQMRFNIYIKCLWLELRVWRVVHARNRFSRGQMVQIRRQLMKLSPRRLLL